MSHSTIIFIFKFVQQAGSIFFKPIEPALKHGHMVAKTQWNPQGTAAGKCSSTTNRLLIKLYRIIQLLYLFLNPYNQHRRFL